MTASFEADLSPDTHQPRVRFNFENGWSASLVLFTYPDGPKPCEAMLGAVAAAPTGQWGQDKTELGSQEAFADEAIAWLAQVADRGEPGAANPTAIAGALRDGLLEQADVEKAYELARAFAEGVNVALNAAADSKDVNAATSLLARAIAARALLVVASDWWADIGGTQPPSGALELVAPRRAYAAALRSFLDRAPPGYVDGSTVKEGV